MLLSPPSSASAWTFYSPASMCRPSDPRSLLL
jgi:hypothetical protein